MEVQENAVQKNPHSIVCQYCGSVILRPNAAKSVKKEDGFFLPYMRQVAKKTDSAEAEGELLHDFWAVTDMFHFENIGFCNTIKDVKYLACADCEAGPVGAHILKTTDFIVAAQRVKELPAETKEDAKT